MGKIAKATLNAFVKNECANYENKTGKCVFDYKCKFLEDKPCRYFERAVLGPPDYKYRKTGYDYEKIFEQYAQINTRYIGKLHKVNVRRCECGTVLKPRQRFCKKCRTKHRQESYRRSKTHKRNS